MLNNKEARGVVSRVVDPVAKALLSIGLTPDAITYIGAAGVSLTALWFFPRGQFVIGVLVILLFVFSDLLDGTMARLSGRAGPWGNYLDSTLDPIPVQLESRCIDASKDIGQSYTIGHFVG